MASLVSDDEIQSLILALAESRKDSVFTEQEAQRLVHWAESVRLESSLLDLVLEGKVLPHVAEGEDISFYRNEKRTQSRGTNEQGTNILRETA